MSEDWGMVDQCGKIPEGIFVLGVECEIVHHVLIVFTDTDQQSDFRLRDKSYSDEYSTGRTG